MSAAAAPELSVSVAQRRPKLVLDPWLCLSAFGPALVQRLQAHAELWLVREFWHILDNSHYFMQQPASLLSESAGAPSPNQYCALFGPANEAGLLAPDAADGRAGMVGLRKSLEFWDGLRLSSDLLGLRLFWLGDGLSESLIPEAAPPQLHPLHERLVEWLDGRLAPRSPLQCAQRDAVALSMALGDVPILSLAEAGDVGLELGRFLEKHDVACRRIDDDDALLELERETWRALLVRANCASLVWSGLSLALFHVSSESSLLAADTDVSEQAEVSLSTFARAQVPRVFWHAL